MESNTMKRGAHFSGDRKHRYLLWRVWDETKPKVMFIGLNPSKANEDANDRTIESVERIARHNDYGGVYMANCWTFVATKPEELEHNPLSDRWNDDTITYAASECKDVVFAWGGFNVVKEKGRDIELVSMFPNALCIGQNSDGSPKHALYQKGTSALVPFNKDLLVK